MKISVIRISGKVKKNTICVSHVNNRFKILAFGFVDNNSRIKEKERKTCSRNQ